MLYRGAVDPDRPLAAVSDGVVRVCGYDRAAFESGERTWGDVVCDDDADRAWARVRAAVDAGEPYDVTYRIRTATGETRRVTERGACVDDGTLAGYVDDVRPGRAVVGRRPGEASSGPDEGSSGPGEASSGQSHRLDETIAETVGDGVYALDAEERFALANDAYCDLVDASREELVGRPVTEVLDEDVVAEARRLTAAVRRGEREVATLAFTVESDGEERALEARFGPFPTGGRVGVLRDVTRRRRRRRRLRRQRERLSDLVDLYDVASEASWAVVEQTDRSSVERRLAERLADGPYALAWVGRTTGTDVTRAANAGGDGVPVDDGALARAAVRAGEVSVAVDREVAHDGERDESTAERATAGEGRRDEPARDASARDGWAAAAVPIAYEGGTYGVFVVHADRRDAFADPERTVLERLGTTVGHAIASLDRRAALLSERVVRVEYRSETAAVALGVPADGRFRFERTVPTGDGEYVHYVRVAGLDRETAVGVFEDTSGYGRVRAVGEHDGDVLIEAVTADAHVTTAVANRGGRLRSVTVEAAEMRIVAAFPQGVDLRTTTEAISEVVPDVELVAQRSTTREEPTDSALLDALSRLTDRQRAAFETAYYGGYFEWPRDSNAEELAAAMGVSSPTFHQHLRKAERTLLGAYVG